MLGSWRRQVSRLSWFYSCRSFDFPLLLNKKREKKTFFRDNLSAGTVVWPVRLVLYKRVALVSCFSCNPPWCVLLGYRCSGVECVLLLTWYCEWTCLCPLLTQSLALDYQCSHLYYALLFYFFFTPISGFTTGVDSPKPPPIYYSTDDLLNFIFLHGCLFMMCEAVVLIYLYSVWVEQPSDIIYDKCSLIVLRTGGENKDPPRPPTAHPPSEAHDVNMCEYFHPWNLTRAVFVRFSFLCWTLFNFVLYASLFL